MSVQHNSTSENLADNLGSINGTNIVIVTSDLKGVKQGGIQYNDARVQDVVLTGWGYDDILQQDLTLLQGVQTQDLVALEAKGHTAWHCGSIVPVTLSDYQLALAELLASRQASLAGTNTSTTDGVFDPLVVDGFFVSSARVYVGTVAEPKGTIYLQGLRMGRKVLSPPPNGYKPAPKSKPLTVAKKALAESLALPSNNYVTYILRPDVSGWSLKIGTKTIKPSLTAGFDVVVS